jgi:hypothetical protein
MKLHLGCGDKILNGFINVDIRKSEGVDIISDISKMSMFKKNSISLIYACHVLEHFGRFEYMDTLKHWYDILESDGILRLSVPDIEKVFEHYFINKDLRTLRGFLWGGQTYDENFHYCGWDFKTLSEDLKIIGFKEVNLYEWKNTEHSDIDDYSQCYLPHMDKERGILMSLNIEAKK